MPATYYQDPTEKAATALRATNADMDGGANKGGSNAPGLGINVGAEGLSNGAVKLSEWTVLDQHGAARSPQDGAHIGEGTTGLGTAGPGAVPINVTDNALDHNNTAVFTDEAVGWVNTAVA